MQIQWVRIKGFRNFDDEKIHFADKSLIIGANDVGKTNLIYALRLLFDRNLSDRDLDLNDSDYNVYTKAEDIEITVCISEIIEDCLKSIFKGSIENETTYIQYQNSKHGNYSILTGPTIDLLELKQGRFYLGRICMEYVDTNRDLFSFMKRERVKLLEYSKTLLDERLAAEDEAITKNIQSNLDAMNDSIDNLHYIKSSLEVVNSELDELSIHNKDQNVRFVTANNDVGQMLDNLNLAYSTDDSPLSIGGDGRTNQIFLATWIAKQKIQKTVERVVIFAIEEPEAHLHPHQQRKLSKYLVSNFDKQIFITTHSPQIASEFKPNKIVRLYAENKISQVAQGGCSKNMGITFNEFGYRLNAITSEIFFANGIFIVEGVSEKLFYSALASQIGIDIDRLNLSIIPVDGVGFKPYIKTCMALKLPFVLRTDNDIFTRKRAGEIYHYFAGISRVMGIYNELIATTSDEIASYWYANNDNNGWYGDRDDYPQESICFSNYIRKELESCDIFLSLSDLEGDLVNSKLFCSLSSFYKQTNKSKLIKKMQERKAENMMGYLSKNLGDLDILKDDDISLPLQRLVEITERAVHPYE